MILPKLLWKLYACMAICFFFFSFSSSGQTIPVKGTVTDTLSKTAMHNAVIYLKNPKDSSLVKYTRADTRGGFELGAIDAGRYIMVVTYPNYVDWIDSVDIKGNAPMNIMVALTTKAHLLQEVIVRQSIAPIRIKGDTTEYLADSFHVKPGATVEDLLKVMPGISVNSKGEITTQGQKVQKVLVDGDEFFGDDPTMATQNLNAKDVAKVQVYDRKSDQSTLTGIDDGSKEKTVNLIMKEDAKKGYFGSATAGTDFNKYYSSKITASRFTSTLKAGALITADRTGRNGMSWEEMQDYGSVSSSVENGEIQFNWEGDDDFDPYEQQGIPENLQTAFMVNKKFGKLKSSTANNFSYNHLNLAGDGSTNTKYVLPDTVYYNNQSRSTTSSKWKQNLSTKNEFNLDSLTTININVKASKGKTYNNGLQNGEYLTGSKIPVNTSTRINSSSGDNSSTKADIFFRRKLNQAGTRSFTLSTGITQNQNSSDGFLYNKTDFYVNGLPATQQVVDQRKLNKTDSRSVQGLVSYIEPLGKKLSLNLNYTFNTNNTDQDTRSYDNRNGKYDSLNLLYSNHYRFINTSHRGGFTFNYTTKKITARAGLAIQDLALKQTNIIKDSSLARNFTNFFPNANIRWKFSTSGSLYFSYNGGTRQPSLMQLQPILNNTDPLSVVKGNPDLRPAFSHNIYFQLQDFKVISNRNIWGYGSFNFTENAFSNKSTVDNQGRRTTQTVNVNGNYNYYSSFSISRQIKFLKLDIDLSPRLNGSRNMSFVNDKENITNSFNFGTSLGIRKYIEKKMSVSFSYNAGYNHSTSSINPGAFTEYWTQGMDVYFYYRFKGGFEFNTNYNYQYRQKLSPTDKNNNTMIWNASIEKKLLKKADITAILSVNDILNQRIGFNRDISSNYVTESTYTTLQRYALVSLRWKFNKNRKSGDGDE
ncbi:MAG: outer membrane beta-barrel protein [Bacteroidota bacterium]